MKSIFLLLQIVAVSADPCVDWCMTLDADNSTTIDMDEAFKGLFGQKDLMDYVDAEGGVTCGDLCDTIALVHATEKPAERTPFIVVLATIPHSGNTWIRNHRNLHISYWRSDPAFFRLGLPG